jgi:cathepsin D
LSGNISDYKRELKSNPLTMHSGMMWLGTVSVGTPRVKFQVEFDTGSSGFFLAGENCRPLPGHNRYNPTKSDTAKSLRKFFRTRFGDGSTVFGTQYIDTVTIAGLTVTEQALGAATQWALSYESPADGLMGMGFRDVSRYNARTVFETLMQQGQTTSPIFAFKFANEGAELTLGGVKDDLYTGGITYAQVTDENKWRIVCNFLHVDGQTILQETPCLVDSVCSKYCFLTLLD